MWITNLKPTDCFKNLVYTASSFLFTYVFKASTTTPASITSAILFIKRPTFQKSLLSNPGFLKKNL